MVMVMCHLATVLKANHAVVGGVRSLLRVLRHPAQNASLHRL